MSCDVARLDVRGLPPDEVDLSSVVAHLRGGRVLAYPTETVYGFGGICRADAVERVRALKRRAEDKPLLVLVGDVGAVSHLAWSPEARALAQVFWPGALTLVLSDPESSFPPGIRSEGGTVAVRVSPHPWVRALLAAVGEPITSSSANAPGDAPARSGEQALRIGRELAGGRDLLVLDAGELEPSEPSTIVDCARGRPVVVRQGSVPVNRLRCVLPEIAVR